MSSEKSRKRKAGSTLEALRCLKQPVLSSQKISQSHDLQPPTQKHLSAVAAARLAKQTRDEIPSATTRFRNHTATASAIGSAPYDVIKSDLADSSVVSGIEDHAPMWPENIQARQLSTFKPGKDNVIEDDRHSFKFTLHKGETATFIGEYTIEVSEGAVTILGALLHNKTVKHRVCATSTHSLPPLTARSDATVCIRSVKSTLRKLEKLSPLFRNIWADSKPGERSFQFLQDVEQDKLQRSLDLLELDRETDAFISTALTSATSSSRKVGITVGAKSTGKSTINRMLVNSSLRKYTSCYYLDLDPGQPECGPSGQISLLCLSSFLLGPSYCNSVVSAASSGIEIVKSHTLAANSFKDDPHHYVACAKDLFDVYRSRFHNQPLIINPCGWVSGIGNSILLELVEYFNPSVGLVIEPLERELALSLHTKLRSTATKIHSVARKPVRSSPRTPAELRAMQSIAFFHSRASPSSFAKQEAVFHAKPLAHIRPWIVTYAGQDAAISAIVSFGQQPSPQFLSEILPGAVVAIVVVDHGSPLSTAEDVCCEQIPSSTSQTGLPYLVPNTQGLLPPPDPKHSRCVGLALVRAIDETTRTLQLVCPLSISQLTSAVSGDEGQHRRQVMLVRGSFDPPEWAYLEDLHRDSYVSNTGCTDDIGSDFDLIDRPWVSRREMVGIESAVWRVRHPPIASSAGR